MVAMMAISLVSCGKQADNNDPYKDMSKDDLKGIIYNLQDQVYSLQNEVNEKTTLRAFRQIQILQLAYRQCRMVQVD